MSESPFADVVAVRTPWSAGDAAVTVIELRTPFWKVLASDCGAASNTPVALASLAVAIVMLYRGRTEAARPVTRQREHADHSI